MPPKPRVVSIPLYHPPEAAPLHIVGDGAIAHPAVGEGRLIGVAILDTSDRPDIEEYIRVHQHIPVGNVEAQWGVAEGRPNLIRLVLRFLRPSELVAIVEFDLDDNNGALVEQILTTKAVYIQSGREGDRVRRNIDRPKVIVEVPDTGFRAAWDEMFLKHSIGQMRKAGFARHEAKRRAKLFVDEIRSTAHAIRVPTGLQE